MKEYFEETIELLNNLTDEEFDNLLIESGIEKCPIKSDYNIQFEQDMQPMEKIKEYCIKPAMKVRITRDEYNEYKSSDELFNLKKDKVA